eukprot:CAMPEP_0185622612 /NCGR_PEP_ID=MMETSP0436-20130131/59335_1 /TAXON_ID=626734 ORGANISM="Favella taraikaensis, Strain Fe Narragansett Bay" /NCGR_SAMPLE_ID=MMETSP0436 /ASSEMBLY_ACC=CAM_ASM_000390 /LENGTH=311 /DNA_ID=CAMNT_0028264397 /DNA_START=1939 /DNA_END=2873 /DNA_ORIENTATION=-
MATVGTAGAAVAVAAAGVLGLLDTRPTPTNQHRSTLYCAGSTRISTKGRQPTPRASTATILTIARKITTKSSHSTGQRVAVKVTTITATIIITVAASLAECTRGVGSMSEGTQRGEAHPTRIEEWHSRDLRGTVLRKCIAMQRLLKVIMQAAQTPNHTMASTSHVSRSIHPPNRSRRSPSDQRLTPRLPNTTATTCLAPGLKAAATSAAASNRYQASAAPAPAEQRRSPPPLALQEGSSGGSRHLKLTDYDYAAGAAGGSSARGAAGGQDVASSGQGRSGGSGGGNDKRAQAYRDRRYVYGEESPSAAASR